MLIKKTILMLLISFATFAADFTIDVNPAANSVDDSKVSSISSSKISDLASVLSSYLLKTDLPVCSAGQFLKKTGASSYSCESPVIEAIPSGMVMPFAGSTCPSGWLFADGSSVSRTTYANLYTAIGNAHGTANGTSFNLPDYRGRFLRGVDGSAGRDPDKASRSAMNTGGATGDSVGSVQGHAFQSHSHSVSDPGHAHEVRYNYNGGGVSLNGGGSQYQMPYSAGGSNNNELKVSPSVSNVSVTTPNSGNVSSETRPLNANVNYCIKI